MERSETGGHIQNKLEKEHCRPYEPCDPKKMGKVSYDRFYTESSVQL